MIDGSRDKEIQREISIEIKGGTYINGEIGRGKRKGE